MTTALTETWGVAACGSRGKISVEVDEALSGRERWQLTIECPTWCFRFEISGVQAVADWLAFLQEHHGKMQWAERSIGTFLRRKVWIIKDDEFPDRFFLNVRAAQMVSFTLVDPEVQDLIEALSQALKDLES